jgi:DNA helicase-2/ATP-dependent DNA helicase PcrA
MPPRLDQLTAAQRRAVTHEGGPLLVLGGAGTGKTRVLVERFAWLVDQGVPAEDVLLVTGSQAAADVLRRQVEDALEPPFGELSVLTVPDLCARVLRDHAVAAGVDPFFVPATGADRLALLLDRMEQLTLRRHDFLGNPARLLGTVIERIDRCKLEMVSAEAYGRWAETLEGETGEREREFARLYADHDRLLATEGTLDAGDLALRTVALLEREPVICRRFRHVLVDELQDLDLAHRHVLDGCGAHGRLTAAGDDDGAISRTRGASTENLREFTRRRPETAVVELERQFRSRERVLRAARAVVHPGPEDAEPAAGDAAPGGDVAFWRCANERAQAQAVAADVERLVREGVKPERIAVVVRSVRHEGQGVAVALEERAVPFRVVGAAAFFQRAEVRDVLAWLRLLVDPNDAGAVVRALARPPVELRSADLARCIQIARRRKLDMVGALVAATESPQLPPEARDRILAFLKLHRTMISALDTTRPDLFVHRLIERLGLRRQQLFAANADVVERLQSLARLGELAAAFVRRAPQATPREFGRSIAAVAEAGLREEDHEADARPRSVAVLGMHAAKGLEFDHVYVLGLHSARMPGARSPGYQLLPDALLGDHARPGAESRDAHVADMRRLLHVAMTRARRGLVLSYAGHADRGALQPPSPFVEEARLALGAEWEEHDERLFGPDETLYATFRELRDEMLEELPRVGTRLGELRFDTDLDVAHSVVRYLELVKLAALLERPAGQSVADALPGVNARLLGAVSAQQREVLESSPLDEALLEAERDERARAAAIASRAEPSLEPFLPKRGDGVMLSASDIETYRTCPLKYKFARVFRIPQEPTLNQRFGILVHQVLERFHAGESQSLDEMFGLLEAGWRRGGFGQSDEEQQLAVKVRSALTRYHERFRGEASEPVWFEKAFSFRLGPHLLRGRVDRVDRHPDGTHELIDYKTGRPKTPAQLRDDVQLAVYAMAARDAWDLEASRQSYHYVLDDEKVPLPPAAVDREWISETVFTVAEGILGQGFEPTPSYAACSMCDYRIVCPAAER